MLAMSTSVMKGLGGGDQLREVVYSYVETLAPQTDRSSQDKKETLPSEESISSLPGHLKTALDKLFDYVDKTNFATLGSIGVLGMVLSVILVLSNIEQAMNAIWHVENGRSIIRKIADYLALMILLPISLNLGFAASAVITSDKLLLMVGSFLPIVLTQTLIVKLIPIFFLSLSLLVMYLFFPNTRVKTLPALIGALIAGFFWFEAQNIYISLQVGVARYNAIYGSFATLPLFLIWMYFGWVFILAGAQIAFACQHRDTYDLLSQSSLPSMQLAAAHDILCLLGDAFREDRPVTLEDIQDSYPDYPPALLAHTTDLLINGNILHFKDGDTQILPTMSPENLLPERVIATILGRCPTDTAGGKASKEAFEEAAKVFRITPGT
jgi:membrane protein